MEILTRIVSCLVALTTIAVFSGCASTQQVQQKVVDQPSLVRTLADEGTVHGIAKVVIPKRGIVSVDISGTGVTVFKVTPKTVFTQAKGLQDCQVSEEVTVTYKKVGAELIALSLGKKLAELPAGSTAIDVQELQTLLQQAKQAMPFTLFDSRPSARYHQGHIPGAIMLPFSDLKKADAGGKAADLLPADKNTLLVFYCGGVTCSLSTESAKIAIKHGYTRVRVFSAGEPAWIKKENPLASSARFVRDEHILLIDLRSADLFAAGHIARSINIPADVFKKEYGSETKLPAFKGAPFVFVSDNQSDVHTALDQMRDLGFKKATFFAGNVDQWKKAGLTIETGSVAAPAHLTYIRKLGGHEVSIDEFRRALTDKNILIVDARSVSELKSGVIPGSLNVPSEEAETRYSLVPRDKTVYIHCATGVRAGILYDVLKAKGYSDIKILNGVVKVKNGVVSVTEY